MSDLVFLVTVAAFIGILAMGATALLRDMDDFND